MAYTIEHGPSTSGRSYEQGVSTGPTISGSVSAFDSSFEILKCSIERLEQLESRVHYAPRSVNKEPSELNPTPDTSLIGAINMRTNHLREIADRLERVTKSLDSLVGGLS